MQAAVDANIAVARRCAVQLWEQGHAVICPHLNTAHMERDCRLDHGAWLAGDFKMIARCDAIVMLPGWEESKGARMEEGYAKSLDIPRYYAHPGIYAEPDPPFIGLPELHPTELRSPVQCEAFAEALGRMYRTHLSKNADYSSSNVAGTGEVGLMTRLWDKINRLMNLTGFHIRVDLLDFGPPREPHNESIEDNILDAAVYPVIWMLYRAKKWGR